MNDPSAPKTSLRHPFRWFPEFLTMTRRFGAGRGQARLLSASVLVGIVAGIGAVAFSLACQLVVRLALNGVAGYHPLEPANEHPPAWLPQFAVGTLHPWWLLVLPLIGGLLSGILVFSFAPEAEGHGTDAVIGAYHNPRGTIRYRVPIVKMIASALTIGTGGSGGREGPIAQIGAGFGVFLANLLRMRPAERRVLMAAGMGAGVAAIFRAPLAGALFAAEVLYFSPEFEPEVIMPAGLASVVAYCTFGLIVGVDGWKPLFYTPSDLLSSDNPLQLGPYLLLAMFMVVLAMLYTRSFYGLTALFHRLSMPRHFKPAVGAFLTGAVGLALFFSFGRDENVLAVLAFGYGALQHALTAAPPMEHLPATAGLLLAIALGKIVTTGLTIGSGGSGGVFGPSMVIGGCGGGALGMYLHWVSPELVAQPAAFVLVGMAGFFAAAAKTPFSTIIIVGEMTGNYNLLLPALFVCTLCFLFSDKQSLYRNQVLSRALSPAHQGSWVNDVLAGLRVRQFLTPDWKGPVLRPGDPLNGILDRFDPAAGDVLPVVDKDGRLVGVVGLEEIHIAGLTTHARPLLLAADLMRTDVRPLRPEDGLDRAMELFAENDLLTLPVVDADRRVIGVVRRYDVASTYLRRLHQPRSPVDGLAPMDSRTLTISK